MAGYRNNSKTGDCGDSKVLQFPEWDAESAAAESAARVAFLERRFQEALDKMLDMMPCYSVPGDPAAIQRVAVLGPTPEPSALPSLAPAPRLPTQRGS